MLSTLFAFFLETLGNNFVNNKIQIVFYARLLYLIFLALIIGYSASKVYGEYLWMGVIASQVSDLCIETFLTVSFSAEYYTINFVRIWSNDYPY